MKDTQLQEERRHRIWFFFTLMYLVIDYGRPQDILPIGDLRPGMIIILILSLFLLFHGRIREFSNKQMKMIAFFIILLGLYVPFARNNYFAFLATKDMLTFVPFILSISICITSIKRLKNVFLVSVCLLIYISGYALFNNGVGSGNYFHDENDISLFINMWLPFCYFLFFLEKDRLHKFIYLTGLITGLSSVIVSFSRGGFVGLLCVSLVCWFYSSRKILSLLPIFLLAVVVILVASDRYWERMGTIQEVQEGTAALRIESWKAGWNMFLDNPLGVGGNNFQVRFPEYQTDYFRRDMWGRAAHSLWFTLIPELGIIGISIYFLLIKYNLKDIVYLRKLNNRKTDRSSELQYLHTLSGAFIASLAGYFSSGTFLSVLYYPHYWYMTGILVATTRVAERLLRDAGRATPAAVN